MAPAGRGGEHTRFPFLATVRSLVATVATVLAVSVVVMVIAVVQRPVEMGFLSYGYVQTEQWWWIQHNATTPPGPGAPAPSYVYKPAEEVDYLVIVKALNPSGRGQIHGSINVVRILDIPNASFAGMVQVGHFYPELAPFDLPPHSSHRYRDWRRINDQETLQYLYDKHREDYKGFTVMLVVEATYKPAHSKKSINATYYCWPVTFLLIDAYTSAAGDVACKTTQEMGYPIPWETLPSPPPVPPPATT